MSKEEYLAWRTSIAVSDKPTDTTVQLQNGRIITIRHRPMPDGGWVATHEDITELKKRDESFRLLFDSNPMPMWLMDLQTLRFLAVNDAAIAHYGYPRDEFMRMTTSDLRFRKIATTSIATFMKAVGATVSRSGATRKRADRHSGLRLFQRPRICGSQDTSVRSGRRYRGQAR